MPVRNNRLKISSLYRSPTFGGQAINLFPFGLRRTLWEAPFNHYRRKKFLLSKDRISDTLQNRIYEIRKPVIVKQITATDSPIFVKFSGLGDGSKLLIASITQGIKFF